MYAYFTVHGDFDPDELTEQLNAQPTNSWRKGDKTKNGHVRTFSRWSLHSTLARTELLEAHVADVISQLDRNETAFKEISSKYVGTLELVGYFWNVYPGLYFNASITTGIGRYGLAIDFDFYGLYSHRREDTGFTFDPDDRDPS